MSLSYRELRDRAIVHLPEDGESMDSRSCVAAVAMPRDVVFVGVITDPAPACAPTLGELDRVALATVVNG